ncbi:TauD/TfdA dioxygenase family protein [Gluconacetobacter sacchari]|uniref:Taurine dioxygenase n=2 Tax=Gluconacetobacter sacchari TaxID=92759 RepID=A0A7W4IFM7_9PROT|nr:TauD/TfdA family dioxygenase [Gluconacetobacter sacchari]MBB2161979.1 taurine dioxygenase [Gluconacetobacter sacchari]GBQ18679.1 taurine dioxygenase [Gluconacetobacter sacchari DSM 12717]
MNATCLEGGVIVRPVTARIGAEIDGVDLTRPLAEPTLRGLRDALLRHQVIFFRDQPITHHDHLRLGRAFGTLAIHSGVPGLPDHPEIVAIQADENSRYVAGENWHSDLSCNAEPPMGSILAMKVVPDYGGDTCFASMYAAYDALSEPMRHFLDGLTAIHDGEHVYRPIVGPNGQTFPCSEHPVVRTHPETGRRCLFVNPSYTTRIPQLSKLESDAVLAMLYRHCMAADFQVRFRWRPDSIAFWDNRCTQHQAIWDYFPQVRSGFRVTIAGDRPS